MSDWKKMFETVEANGTKSLYAKDQEIGVWRRSSDPHIDMVYVGSINPDENMALEGEHFDKVAILCQLVLGMIRGFTPEFEVGYHPLEIDCRPTDVLEVAAGKLLLSIDREALPGYKIHVGHPISLVYK
ncbi:MAG: hypothetical protein CMH61_00340 [Nanoarchaeota archaeon]|nr:hypothetical protein [Nanoarchaeota archaeon]|tara:strand:- start:3009 stop:3395 length:387 start_codon:yes stop_codon:yes gene_type:complete